MHSFDLVIYVLAAALTVAAYLRDPSLPGVGLRHGGQLLLDVLPRLIGALIMTGMLQVLIAPEWIEHPENPMGVGVTTEDLVRALRFIVQTPSYTGDVLIVDSGEHLTGRPRDIAFHKKK